MSGRAIDPLGEGSCDRLLPSKRPARKLRKQGVFREGGNDSKTAHASFGSFPAFCDLAAVARADKHAAWITPEALCGRRRRGPRATSTAIALLL
jgi:hypothetical protein